MAAPLATNALLVRSVDFRDADRIITFVTADFGKISAIARGARRSQRRFGGALQPFAVLDIQMTRGASSSLAHLRAAGIVRAFPGIMSHLGKVAMAGAALELLREAVAEDDQDREVFQLTVQALGSLEQQPGTNDTWLVVYQAQLLRALGWFPSLRACGRCGKRPAADQAALFDPVRGSIICRACGGGKILLSAEVRGWIQRLGSSSHVADGGELLDLQVRQARQMLNSFFEHQLHRSLGGNQMVEQLGGARELRPRKDA